MTRPRIKGREATTARLSLKCSEGIRFECWSRVWTCPVVKEIEKQCQGIFPLKDLANHSLFLLRVQVKFGYFFPVAMMLISTSLRSRGQKNNTEATARNDS